MKRIAINGFGRIGRLVLRIILQHFKELEVVAVNDLVPASQLAYLLKFDSVHRRAPFEVKSEDKALVARGKRIHVYEERDPAKLPWKELGIDYVVEASGHFTDVNEAKKHLDAGAKRVIITAPAKGDVPTLVMGVNHETFNPAKDAIISNASCTTNCLAAMTKVLLDAFGIEEGLMTTVHSLTASQHSVDGPSHRDMRGGRAASMNIIPSSTGAAKSVALCLPEVKGKLTGMAFRIPTIDVSAVDLTVRLSRDTSYEEVCAAFKEAASGKMRGIVDYCDEEVVSTDFIGANASCIFDAGAGIGLNKRFYKLIAWYDNEWGYAFRVADLIAYCASRETK